MAALPPASQELEVFLEPLRIDAGKVHRLALDLCETFKDLAATSDDQFLPTPISESILSHHAAVAAAAGHDGGGSSGKSGPYLAIDIGGTNLRVGFVELGGALEDGRRTVDRHLEKYWSIEEHLKNENAHALFAWIGERIAEVVRLGCDRFEALSTAIELPMGVTFSFPMDQESLDRATLRAMGKGFAITSRVDLGKHLLNGYETSRGELPRIRIAAITNDAVATLVSFMHQFPLSFFETKDQRTLIQRPAMGLICGTGSNATILMRLGSLKETKRPRQVKVLPTVAANGNMDGASDDDVKIAVNSEWSINGSAGPIRAHSLISRWDDELSAAVDKPGFQPLEYMTAGRYLGELGRIMLVDYMTTVCGLDPSTFPSKLMCRFDPRNTTWLGHFRPKTRGTDDLLALLNEKFPPDHGVGCNGPATGVENLRPQELLSTASPRLPNSEAGFCWTRELAEALYHIARAVEFRAAGLIAAATVGLLKCSGALPTWSELESYDQAGRRAAELQLAIGYTGGCITNFQDYLQHCQQLLDEVALMEYPSGRDDGGGGDSGAGSGRRGARVRIVLKPCHDGGIDGAGILVPAAVASR